MQLLKISPTLTLLQLSKMIGERNVEHVLAANDLVRSPNIGKAFAYICQSVVNSTLPVDWQRKSTLLNSFTSQSDIFEAAALLGESGWKVLSTLGTFSNTLRIPDSIILPDSTMILGNSEPVDKTTYAKVMKSLKEPPHSIDPSIFNKYDTLSKGSLDSSSTKYTSSTPFQWFKLPWGEITLHSSIDNQSIDFPVYPEELKDGRSATYDTMPDMLYQYEPWQVYKSSGPREVTYTFNFHRDMWTGDHRDGKAAELIRFCEANCYPEYNGSAVNTSTVSLYIAGKRHICGVMKDVSVSWDGPIGLDGWYLHCTLELSIIEVANKALTYSSVKGKGLIE